jgi:hypothetical protein
LCRSSLLLCNRSACLAADAAICLTDFVLRRFRIQCCPYAFWGRHETARILQVVAAAESKTSGRSDMSPLFCICVESASVSGLGCGFFCNCNSHRGANPSRELLAAHETFIWARKIYSSNGSDHGRLNGKVAIITGAGTGIGEAIAHKFAKEGARVVVSGLPDDPIEDVARSDSDKRRGGNCARRGRVR